MSHANAEQASPEVPVACLLNANDLRLRSDQIMRPLFQGRQEVRELATGYALRFPGEAGWASRLLEFIEGERACCPFFTFELIFEPSQGPIWLHLRGPEGTKAIVAEMLAIKSLP
ncbi:MAG: hypothetical protein ACRDG4_21020 [Chloroflexota bacterium]